MEWLCGSSNAVNRCVRVEFSKYDKREIREPMFREKLLQLLTNELECDMINLDAISPPWNGQGDGDPPQEEDAYIRHSSLLLLAASFSTLHTRFPSQSRLGTFNREIARSYRGRDGDVIKWKFQRWISNLLNGRAGNSVVFSRSGYWTSGTSCIRVNVIAN